MENWREYEKETQVDNLISEIIQLSNEIIEYTSLITEENRLDEAFVQKAAEWLGSKWEQLSGKVDALYQKTQEVMSVIKSIPAEASDAYLNACLKIYAALVRIMPQGEQAEINKILKEFSNAIINICEEELGEGFHEDVRKVVDETMRKYVANSDLPENKEERVKWFKTHQKEYLKILEKDILEAPAMRKVKMIIDEAIDRKGEQIFEEIKERLNSKVTWRSVRDFMLGGSFMFVFGVIDNVGLLIGMAGLENYIEVTLGMTSIVSGLGANGFSDELGVVLAWPVAMLLKKMFGVKGEGTFMQQFVMIGAGTSSVMVLRMLWEYYFLQGFVVPR